MQADFSVELGAEDPTLAVPWSDPEGRIEYFDLHHHPEQVDRVEEAQTFPGLRDFLMALNSNSSGLETAKCDAWFSEDLSEEEAIFGATCKMVSYVDILFEDEELQLSFSNCEDFARRLVVLLDRAPEIPAAAEIVIRRLHFDRGSGEIQEGFCFTLYVTGYGDEEEQAEQSWGIALRLVGNAVLQLSRRHPA